MPVRCWGLKVASIMNSNDSDRIVRYEVKAVYDVSSKGIMMNVIF